MDEQEEPTGISKHTGFPNPAIDKSLHGLDINKLLIRNPGSTYLFKVRGNNWQDAGVHDSDIAVIDRALDPRKNDVVLWWDGQRGEFAISYHSAIPIDASCWGVVTATVHEFRKRNHEHL
ncbi:MAG TPA: S24 family peptidase [Candidatus Saccharimonadales bacterium]|nr:S24 family peptidase [Candidatus Saccharimonadales bacterium]